MRFAWDIRARVQFEGDAHVLEDSCGFNGPNAWIIDGATSLLEPLDLPAASDPQWLAQQLSIILAQISSSPGNPATPDTPGRDGVRGLLAAALAAIDVTGSVLVGAEKVRFPSAAVSLAQLSADGVEIASLADCTVVVRTHDGATHLVRAELADSRVPDGTPEQRLRLLRQDREMRNTPGRLWVARREAAAADHAHVVRLGPPEIMVMASDGAWRAVDLGLVSGPEEFLARTSTTVDALGLMHELRVHQGRIGEVADDATVLTLAPRP
ncbi:MULTISPECIES: hypothetical protein [unclassified Arthrobacter]|uniref:hypothetical protein n=1 Tax=unclassified Arthrobacter TaxID=235627 RepID=UPI000CE3B7AE|nr:MULTISPECIES: hypothetical protein [unclassified Arthrobacter]